MGILNFVFVYMTEAAISQSADDGTIVSCQNAFTSWIDFAIVAVICATIIGVVYIIALRVKQIITENISKRNEEAAAIRIYNQYKIDSENVRRENKDRYDAAWRFIEWCWKTEYSKSEGTAGNSFGNSGEKHLTEVDRKRCQEAWDFIKSIWEVDSEPVKKIDINPNQL